MKLYQLSVMILPVTILAGGCSTKQPGSRKQEKEKKPGEYQLVWNDEFDYTGLPDSTKWSYDTEGNADGWGNWEEQFYTEERIENAKVENGVLRITAIKEPFQDRHYTSARLVSRAEWQYGMFEIRAKVPPARGTWSAIWMMPGGWSYKTGNWPDVGEFDIMEHVGHDAGLIHASAHSKDYQWQKGTQKTDTIRISDATETFHSYIWEWSQDAVKAYVDDSLYFIYENEGLGESKWPYDKPFYLILNVAVGGAWAHIEGIDDAAFPQTMEIDYVRVYKK